MKPFILNVRISQDLRDSLDKEALSIDISVSDLVRDILIEHYEKLEFNLNNWKELIKIVKYDSYDFIALISWLYEKRVNNYDSNSEISLYQFKEIVLKIMKDDYYPQDLRRELEKVLVDISRYCIESNSDKKYFCFGIPNYPGSFNYNVLHDFIIKQGFTCQIIQH